MRLVSRFNDATSPATLWMSIGESRQSSATRRIPVESI
jgi:hypothetical protein